MTFFAKSVLLLPMILTIFFFQCSFTRSLISFLEPLLSSTLKKHTLLTQDTLLFNYPNSIGTPHIITSKLGSLIRLSLYTLRNSFSSFNTPIPISTLIEEKFKIKTKFKAFLEKNFPDYLQ